MHIVKSSYILHSTVPSCTTNVVIDALQVRAENQQLRLAAAGGTSGTRASASTVAAPAAVGSAADAGALSKQLKEFTLNTQLELERSLKACESRAVMAEEQLAHLQVCLVHKIISNESSSRT